MGHRPAELHYAASGGELKNDGKSNNSVCSDRGYLEVVKFLIKSGVPVILRDSRGRTALHMAAAYCKLDIIEYLLVSAGIDWKDPIQRDVSYS